MFLTQLATCHSEHLQKWMGTFYAYKGLLLLFGVYMAWETRNVKIPALNDSQYIGFNVYNVVLMSVCVVVLSSILSSQPTLSYAIESAFMVVSTTVTLCLLFVPKVRWTGCVVMVLAPYLTSLMASVDVRQHLKNGANMGASLA